MVIITPSIQDGVVSQNNMFKCIGWLFYSPKALCIKGKIDSHLIARVSKLISDSGEG